MDTCRLKKVSHVQWCPPSVVIPAYDTKDIKSIIHIDLLEWMNKAPEFDKGRGHKVRFNARSTCPPRH